MQVAEASQVSTQPPAGGQRALTGSEQRRMRATAAAPPDTDRPPALWSREEAMLRTCSWGAVGPADWAPGDLGGNDVFRSARSYTADRSSATAAAQACTKHQASNINLLPGMMLYWCTTCHKCIFFHVMADVESPR